MVNVTPTIVSSALKARWEHFLATGLNTNDTITFADLNSITTIVGLKTLDGTALTFTIAGNVATLTTAAQTNINIAGTVWGATNP